MMGFLRKKALKKVAALGAAALFASLCAGGALAVDATPPEQENWDKYPKIATVSPENVTIHLFDYWITAGNNNEVGSGAEGAGRWVWDSELNNGHLETGINKGHAFKFGGSSSALAGKWEQKSNKWEYIVAKIGNDVNSPQIAAWSEAGPWNNSTGFGFALVNSGEVNDYIAIERGNDPTRYAGNKTYQNAKPYQFEITEGPNASKTLVNRGLFLENNLGVDGYPQLDLTEVFQEAVTYINAPGEDAFSGVKKPKTASDSSGQYGPASTWGNEWASESLAYLFDPTIEHDGKASFADVEGLLKVTDDGYYRFSSYQNFAAFQETDEKKTLKNSDGDEVEVPTGRFHVYEDKGINASGSSPDGQFYPFNTPDQVLTDEGKYNPNVMSKGDEDPNVENNEDVKINHFVGMTMEVPFMQPANGKIGSDDNYKPMVFKFSGDDDTLIYIDGVLVADLSGCHDAITVHIDFSSGEIQQFFSPNQTDAPDPEDPLVPEKKDGSPVPINKSNLRAQFAAAGKENTTQWRGNTFASGTVHTLKMFYLERGHTDSNLTLEFNLVQVAESALHKHNQDGKSMADFTDAYKDLELQLYKIDGTTGDTNRQTVLRALKNGDYDNNDKLTELQTFKADSQKIQSGEKKAWIIDDIRTRILGDEDSVISDGYFLLRETKTPAGYRPVPDVLLYYDKDGAGLLHVVNQWETGARSSFRENSHTLGNVLRYYDYVSADLSEPAPVRDARAGLAVAVPLMRQTEEGDWAPLYGNHIWGYTPANPYSEGNDWRHNELMAVLDAALHQIYYTCHGDDDYKNYGEKWIVDYDKQTDRFAAVLRNLPGDVNQYEWVYDTEADKQKNASMAMLYYYFDGNALSNKLHISNLDNLKSEEKWNAIADYIDGKVGTNPTIAGVDSAIRKLVIDLIGSGMNTETFHRLHKEDFETVYTPDIYIPNIVNELRVCKLDHTQSVREGKPVTLPGAQFELFTNENGEAVTIATGTTGADGMLIFSAEQEGGKPGSVRVALETGKTYYLKELDPDGRDDGMVTLNGNYIYAINDSVVQIDVTDEGVFANATAVSKDVGAKDGIGVWVGVGKVVETMAMYAADGSLNDSLIRIRAELMTMNDVNAKGKPGTDALGNQVLALTYEEEEAFLQYCPIEADGYNYFTIYDGYGYAHISQLSPDNNPNDDRENLSAYNIDPLFTGSTTVMVSNHRLTDKYSFSGSKTMVGRELYPGEFQFDLYRADAAKAEAGQFIQGEFVESVSNSVIGTFDFGYQNIVDKKVSPQYFYYVIEEKPGDLLGVTYDTTRYGVKVTATGHEPRDSNQQQGSSDTEYENFIVETTYYKLDEKGNATKLEPTAPVEFVNSFVPPPLPTTGDDTNLVLYAAIAALCVSCMALLAYRRRRS